jgi:hypothetical protein
MLFILELLATFSGDGAAMLRKAWLTRSKNTASSSEKSLATANACNKPAKIVANRAYYLSRLEREFPVLAARIRTGELSVYRAAIEAGMRKPPARNWARPEAYHPGQAGHALGHDRRRNVEQKL